MRVRKTSAVRSGFFSLSGQILELCISFGSLAILGRLLTPEDFGTFGIILAVQALFTPLLDMGLTQAFIKLDSMEEHASNAFFTLNVAAGFFNSMCLIVISPILSRIYGIRILTPLTIVFAVSVIIGTLSQQAMAVLSREKYFDKIMVINLIGRLSGFGAAIGGALAGCGVWSLNLRVIIIAVVNWLGTKLILHKRYYFLSWKKIKNFKSSIIFGSEIVISRLLNNVLLSIDKLILGKIFSINTLGQYIKAIQIAVMPDHNIRIALAKPALAHIARHDQKRLRESYKIMCHVILITAGLPCMILIVIGDWIVPWLMGKQWIDAGVYTQLLGIWGLGKVMNGINEILYLNEMRTRRLILITAVAIVLIFCIPFYLAWSGFSPLYFICTLSVGNIIFWGVVMMYSLTIFSGSFRLVRQLGWSFFIILFGALSFGFIFKSFFSKQWINLYEINMTVSILSITIVITLAAFLILFFFNRRQCLNLYSYLRKSIMEF